MLTIQYTEPLLVSGVLINDSALRQISYLQTGVSFTHDIKRTMNNEGVKSMNEIIGDVTHLLIENLINEGADTDRGKVILSHIESIYTIRAFIESFKIPPEMEE